VIIVCLDNKPSVMSKHLSMSWSKSVS
jgi:hypothetical protein